MTITSEKATPLVATPTTIAVSIRQCCRGLIYLAASAAPTAGSSTGTVADHFTIDQFNRPPAPCVLCPASCIVNGYTGFHILCNTGVKTAVRTPNHIDVPSCHWSVAFIISSYKKPIRSEFEYARLRRHISIYEYQTSKIRYLPPWPNKPMHNLVRTRLPGGVGAGGERSLATRLCDYYSSVPRK